MDVVELGDLASPCRADLIMISVKSKIGIMKDKRIKIEKFNNGLTGVFYPIKSAKSISVYVSVGAGPQYEDSRTNGLAHFLEHMLFEGTEEYPSSKKLAEYIENIGGMSGAWTDKEFVVYYAKVPTGRLKFAINYLSQIFFKTLLRIEDIEKEKKIVLEELNRSKDNPEMAIWDMGMEWAWGNDNYLGKSTLGNVRRIKGTTKNKLEKYLKDLYFPGNMNLIIVGDFSVADAKKNISELFNINKKSKMIQTKKIIVSERKNHVKIIKADTFQTQVLMGFSTKVGSKHKDNYTLKLIADILGLGVSSRLFNGLVYNLAVAYSVWTGFWSFRDCGLLYVSGGISQEGTKQALGFVLKETQRLKKEKISEKELKEVKEKSKASLDFSLETTDGLAKLYAEQIAKEDKITIPEDVKRKLDEITAEDIQRAANEYLDVNNLFLVIRGNVSKSEQKNIEGLIGRFM